jgi:hypothetical protein
MTRAMLFCKDWIDSAAFTIGDGYRKKAKFGTWQAMGRV